MSGSIGVIEEGLLSWMILQNSAHRNALTTKMWAQIPEVLDNLSRKKNRVVILTGEGKEAFGSAQSEKYQKLIHNAIESIKNFKAPIISLIRGYCLGGGCGLALSTDLRYATPNAVFGITPSKIGLGYSQEATEELISAVGFPNAKEILFTGNRYDSQKALKMGIINDIFDENSIENKVRKIADIISHNAPLSVQHAKITINELMKKDEKPNTEKIQKSFITCIKSEDYKEGILAFLEKRKADFKGE
ncbi:enoyl-coa hydratase [Anaeramoeba ignava]|uniref:Enoyl-coa hydratase n=1 Tax=Anaeramoeba ignava TaxID=1746090 RepID=A0A9Q0R4A4_ANAIG|nr:enoyl-coa hydratase [Anaeramoeba ignava]